MTVDTYDNNSQLNEKITNSKSNKYIWGNENQKNKYRINIANTDPKFCHECFYLIAI